MRQNVVFEMVGLPELAANLDKITSLVAGPLTREALRAGAAVIQLEAEIQVHKLTGALAADIVVVTRIQEKNAERYVLIGPGWDPNNFRRVVRNRAAVSREVRPDQTTNPGIYGYFLEVGHRSAGQGLRNLPDYRRDARLAKKQGKKVDTSKYGTITVPAYPWLGPAFEAKKDEAFSIIGETIRKRLEALNVL